MRPGSSTRLQALPDPRLDLHLSASISWSVVRTRVRHHSHISRCSSTWANTVPRSFAEQ